MAGIGEASAIIGVLQVGFSLATALNTYISDVSDAGDDISSLVSDIEATLGQLRDLGKLIEKNETTKAWSEDGLHNAKKCVTDCEKIITKLRKLLKKSTASATSDEVTRDEIDVSKLEKAIWPIIKPQLEVRRRELQSIKQDIMIAYSSYMTQVGTDTERQKYTDDLPSLQRTRALARKQVREAKERRRRYGSARQTRSQLRPQVQLPPSSIPLDTAYIYPPPPASISNDGRGSALDDEGPLVYDDVDDLEREFEAWKAEEEQRRVAEVAERKKVEDEAIENWKQQQLQEVEARRQKIENDRSSLRAELTKQRVAPQQIEEIVNHMHPQQQVNNDLRLLSLTPVSEKASSVTSGDGPAKSTTSHRWSVWSKKSGSGPRSITASTAVGESKQRPIPDYLQDPTAEGGIAPLEASYFQRSLGAPPRVQNFNIEIPNQWLLDNLILRQEATANSWKTTNSIWRDFSLLPDDYRYAISDHMNERTDYDRRGKRITWVLLHIECMVEKRRRSSIFDRGFREEVVGVYVVLKQNRRRDPSPEQASNRDVRNEDAILSIVRREEDYGSRRQSENESSERRNSRYRSSKTGYEPRHALFYSKKEPARSRSRRVSKEDYYPRHEDPEIYEVDYGGRQYEKENEMQMQMEKEMEMKMKMKMEIEKEKEREREYRERQAERAYREREWASRESSRPHQRDSSPDYGNNRRPDDAFGLREGVLRPPQSSYERDLRQTDPRYQPKSVSFRDRPGDSNAYILAPPVEQGRGLPPGINVPLSFADMTPTEFKRIYEQLYSLRSQGQASDRRNTSPRRSPSPRPIRRTGTGDSYRSEDSTSSLAQGGYLPIPEPRGELKPRQPLDDIEEISEDSELSISSDESDGEGNLTRRKRHPLRRETDKELLDKTLKEYVNPHHAGVGDGEAGAKVVPAAVAESVSSQAYSSSNERDKAAVDLNSLYE